MLEKRTINKSIKKSLVKGGIEYLDSKNRILIIRYTLHKTRILEYENFFIKCSASFLAGQNDDKLGCKIECNPDEEMIISPDMIKPIVREPKRIVITGKELDRRENNKKIWEAIRSLKESVKK